jgi:hypothetical protein
MIARINLLAFLVVLALTACALPVGGEALPAHPSAAYTDAATQPTDQGTATSQLPLPPSDDKAGAAISFVINVHDWVNADDSAATLLRLVDLFEKYHVRGDFYVTAPVVEGLLRLHPQVIERLKASQMTISYHVRPPHPLYPGFDARLQGLSDADLFNTLLDYETYRLDLATGGLDRSSPGGYAYVAAAFGRKPVTASAPSSDPRIKAMAEKVYARLGAQVTVHYHEQGTRVSQPFEYSNGLLIRPSDFSITRIPDGRNFWWNFMSSPHAQEFDPVRMLQDRLADWTASRPPLITALIHENNFYRSGAEAWTAVYYAAENKNEPLSPPFDLHAAGQSKPRPPAEQEAIWQMYERLVAYAAAHLRVITSADLPSLSQGGF